MLIHIKSNLRSTVTVFYWLFSLFGNLCLLFCTNSIPRKALCTEDLDHEAVARWTKFLMFLCPQAQFIELFSVDFTGRTGQETLASLSLGECDYVSYIFRACQ